MDIQHLVDRLEDLIDEGRHMPMSKYTLIDEERALEIIDQMRISVPEEIEKSARVLAQRDRVLAQANEEAARVIAAARERGEKLLDNEASVQAAKSHAANIIEQAKQDAEQITSEADRYVMEVLTNLQERLQRLGREVHAGISVVENKPPVQGAPSEFAPPSRESVNVPTEQQSNKQLRQKPPTE